MTSTGQRFTLDGSEDLERHLSAVCHQVRAAVEDLVSARRLEGLLLGGGYGRGQGGVLRTPAGDRPYNDLEFYVLLRGSTLWNERSFRGRLHELGEQLTPGAGVEIEFKVISSRQLRRSPTTMFYYDLVVGHRRLAGGDDLLTSCAHHREPRFIPSWEATRLLMNRCSGLLFSAEHLARPSFGPEEADFVGRNLAKAQLGLGDAVLTFEREYHWSCLVRRDRLGQLQISGKPAWAGLLGQHHAAGVEFKLHPVRSTERREFLEQQHRELTALAREVWLWLESRRLQTEFDSTWDYACSSIDKCPETNPLKNRLLNLRTFGPTILLDRSGGRYPRERLLTALALLLFERARLGDRAVLRRIQEALQTSAAGFPELVGAYQRLWSRFN